MIEGQTAALGAGHTSTLMTKGNIALVLSMRGELDAADALNTEATGGLLAALGYAHQLVILFAGPRYSNRAAMDKSEEGLASALAFCSGRAWLGAEHPFTLWVAARETGPVGELSDALTTTTQTTSRWLQMATAVSVALVLWWAAARWFGGGEASLAEFKEL